MTTTRGHAGHHDPASTRRPAGRVGLVWLAGLVVAAGAGVATAHGLYQVAVAARVPRALAWLYPLITDGLALVAYATTTRLTQHGRRYAWTVVVVAAGLSGLTQAGYLAGSVATAPAALRFAIGAWPALAAAIVAHLLYLLGATTPSPSAAPGRPGGTVVPPTPPTTQHRPTAAAPPTPQLSASTVAFAPARSAGVLVTPAATPHDPPRIPQSSDHLVRRLNTGLNAAPPAQPRDEHPPNAASPSPAARSTTPATDRAQTIARDHAARHGRLPTVTELVTLAHVARGTAATALKTLRQPTTTPPAPSTPLHEIRRPR